MFHIRDSQIPAMAASSMHAFEVRLKQHLEDHFAPHPLLTAHQWEALFSKGIQQTKRYKLQTEYGITVFFNIMLTLGADFDTDGYSGRMHEILVDKYATEAEKVERLIDAAEQALDAA